jgi:hypothetical protein
LLRGTPPVNSEEIPDNPSTSIMSQLSWELAYFLDYKYSKHVFTGKNDEGEDIYEESNPFSGLCEHMMEHTDKWETYFNKPEPQYEYLPLESVRIIDYFDKLLILKILRPEKLLFAFTEYVRMELG